MGIPDGKKWSEQIRLDLEWRKSNIDPRMNRSLLLLNPTVKIANNQYRAMAPFARRVARSLVTMDFLHRLPHIDAEYKGQHGEDHSNFVEDLIVLIADRSGVRDRLKQIQATLLWSPVSWVKCGMSLVGVERKDGRSEATPEMTEGVNAFKEEWEEVPPEVAHSLALKDQQIPELDGSFNDDKVTDPLPTPTTSLDMPWCDWVNPFHIICDRGVNEVQDAYYVAHLMVRTKSQFMENPEYINKDIVQSHMTISSEGKDKRGGGFQALGGPLFKTFDIPSADEVVVLCEVFIREDPNDAKIKNTVGTLDLMSGTWVKEPRSNPLGVFPYVTVKASDEAPGIWSGPAYLEQAWDDMAELAWSREEFKRHVRNYRSHKDLVPESLEFSESERKKWEDPNYSGPVTYSSGNPAAITNGPRPPAMPPALIQWRGMMESDFAKNTGITSTQQGDGASNKVATAFRQEGKFASERRSETRYRLYSAYADIMLIMTYLIQRYMVQPVEVRRGAIKFQFSGDTLRGIMGYTIDVIDLERSDPLSDRLLEIQTIERLLGHPVLSQEFNPKELAKRVAQLNRWGGRVLGQPQPAAGGSGSGAPAGGGGPQNPATSGTSGMLGDGVDSGQANGDTVDAVEGAPMRRG